MGTSSLRCLTLLLILGILPLAFAADVICPQSPTDGSQSQNDPLIPVCVEECGSQSTTDRSQSQTDPSSQSPTNPIPVSVEQINNSMTVTAQNRRLPGSKTTNRFIKSPGQGTANRGPGVKSMRRVVTGKVSKQYKTQKPTYLGPLKIFNLVTKATTKNEDIVNEIVMAIPFPDRGVKVITNIGEEIDYEASKLGLETSDASLNNKNGCRTFFFSKRDGPSFAKAFKRRFPNSNINGLNTANHVYVIAPKDEGKSRIYVLPMKKRRAEFYLQEKKGKPQLYATLYTPTKLPDTVYNSNQVEAFRFPGNIVTADEPGNIVIADERQKRNLFDIAKAEADTGNGGPYTIYGKIIENLFIKSPGQGTANRASNKRKNSSLEDEVPPPKSPRSSDLM